jgi:hypothetical protein
MKHTIRAIALLRDIVLRRKSPGVKLRLAVPSALLWLFAYTQHTWDHSYLQAFPPHFTS